MSSVPKSESIKQYLASLGLSDPVDAPANVVGGPFTGIGVITDNATTDIDLTNWAAAGPMKSPAGRQYFSVNNPEAIFRCSGFKAELNVDDEVIDTIDALFPELYIRHVARDGMDKRADLWPGTGGLTSRTHYANDTQSAGAAAVTRFNLHPAKPYFFHSPWDIDLEFDTFAVAPLTAVNVGGDVPLIITLYGALISKDLMSAQKAGRISNGAKYLARQVALKSYQQG